MILNSTRIKLLLGLIVLAALAGAIVLDRKSATAASAVRAGGRTSLAFSSRSSAQQQPFKITLRATAQLEKYPEAKAAFLRAAARWESVIQTPISVIVDVDFGPQLFGEPYQSPETFGATKVQNHFISYGRFSGFLERLRARAITPQQRAAYAALPPDKIITDITEISFVTIPSALARALGELAPFPDFQAERREGAPPSIAFNSNSKFDFDPSDGIDSDKIDFEAAAVREFGRVLGFTSNAGSGEITAFNTQSITAWDVFRFRPGVTLDSFTDALRAQLSGGEQVFFAGGVELPLSTGRADGAGGDGRPAGHWKDDALTGRYLGVMDPTLAPGERGAGITANDLVALQLLGHEIRANAPVMEILSIDDGSREQWAPLEGSMVVNRLTPAHYPATLQAVRVQLPQAAKGSALRIVAFADAARTGQPPAITPSLPLLVDRTVTVPAVPETGWIEFVIANGPVITADDLYIGVQASGKDVSVAADTSAGPESLSFISNNNGASFQPLLADQAPANLMARGVVSSTFDKPVVPGLRAMTPTAAEPGGNGFTLTVYGSDFQGLREEGFATHSFVRWNSEDRPTTFISSSVLLAQIYEIDIAKLGVGRVTVYTPGPNGGAESAPLKFTITPNMPAPKLLALTPDASATGSAPLVVTLTGREFNQKSVVRWNGSDRATEFINSAELRATITAADLVGAGKAEITVSTPGPGGGVSNPLSFTVAPCSYALANVEQAYSSARLTGAATITTIGNCAWTAQTDAPWIRLDQANNGTRSGVGPALITFLLLENLTGTARTGVINLGSQQLTVRQVENIAVASAANYSTSVAPDSIALIFGTSLATSTQSATNTPLPTTLAGATLKISEYNGGSVSAPLFFVSPKQINFFVPSNLNLIYDPGDSSFIPSRKVEVFNDGALVADGYLSFYPGPAPGLFSANASGAGTAAGVVLRVKADGSQIYEPIAVYDESKKRYVSQPIDLGSDADKIYLVLFGTGIRNRSSLDSVKVTVGEVNAPVLYAGPQGGLLGLDQINVQIPSGLKGRGEVRIRATVDGKGANNLLVAFQ